MQKRSECPNRRGMAASRIVMIVVLIAAVGAGAFEILQWNRRNNAEAALLKYDLNPKRDPNDPKKVIPPPDRPPATRDEIHEKVFGGSKPTETSEEGRLALKESWTYPGIFTNYVVDVNYNLVTKDVVDPASEEGKKQDYQYQFDIAKTRNVSHFASGPLIANKEFSAVPNFDPRVAVGDGPPGGGGGGGNQGGGGSTMRVDDGSGDGQSGDGQSGDDQSGDDQSGDAQSGDDQSGDANSGDAGEEPPITAPPTGGDDANKGDANKGDTGSGDDQKGDNQQGGDQKGDDQNGDDQKGDDQQGGSGSGDTGAGGSGGSL